MTPDANLEQVLERILERARQGAQSAQASMRQAETSDVSFDNDRLKSAESSQRTQIDLTVIVDGKAGTSSTTDPADIDGVVGRALEAARLGSPAHYDLPAPRPLPEVQTYDPALVALGKPEMIHMGRSMMDMVKAYSPEILARAGLTRTVTQLAVANSAGVSYSAEHTDFAAGTGGQRVRGNDILFAGEGAGSKQRDIDTEALADRAIEYFRISEREAAIDSGTLPVIFTPGGATALLLTLALALDGKRAYLGESPLRDKLGRAIADPRLSLVDDPTVAYGPQTRAFDDEGVACEPLPLIENGVLRNFIYDLDTAGRAGVRPTGHGRFRRYSNLIVNPGDSAYAEMLRGVKRGLLVHEYLGLGQGNPINGEFSANVYMGYKIEDGEIVGRVKDVMLAGNVYDALRNVEAISREQEWVSGDYAWFPGLFPYIQVGGLNVTAK
jgi:PmbA protein